MFFLRGRQEWSLARRHNVTKSLLSHLCAFAFCVRPARESAKLYELLSHDETDWLPVVPPRTPV